MTNQGPSPGSYTLTQSPGAGFGSSPACWVPHLPLLPSPHPILPLTTTSLRPIRKRDPAGPIAPHPTRRPTRPDPRAPETRSKQGKPRTPDFKLIRPIRTDPNRSDPIRPPRLTSV
ncbi:hypothetical protein PGT21_030928 [Puccinia graminis f. sp. tritici]|uniref:Uncharacterized protein n=1 Tax=Puccinia graminis f. sp. tritici TaxID=56615 RepID=A0A5B0R2N7_PUCGR|nr:hypothetical protein PGT21_030928 [Puccinia graminis f. sp. tritici]